MFSFAVHRVKVLDIVTKNSYNTFKSVLLEKLRVGWSKMLLPSIPNKKLLTRFMRQSNKYPSVRQSNKTIS